MTDAVATSQKANGKTQANRSVTKALRILDYFRVHPEGRLFDLAEHAGLGPSTALRLILSLEKGGALVRSSDTREYSIGPWLLELAATAVRSHPYTAYVHQVLTELRETTGETASYWIVDVDQRLCLDRVLSEQALSSTIHVGTRLPLYLGAAGRVLMAFMPDENRRQLLTLLRRKSVDVDALVESLEHVHGAGYATSVEERERGLASVAAAVVKERELLGAVSLTAPVGRFGANRRRAVVADLKAAAERLSTYGVLDRR